MYSGKQGTGQAIDYFLSFPVFLIFFAFFFGLWLQSVDLDKVLSVDRYM